LTYKNRIAGYLKIPDSKEAYDKTIGRLFWTS
jgi:hypothetical protein